MEEQVIDVVAEEVTEQPEPVVEEQPAPQYNPFEEYANYKKTEYKMKQLRKQLQNNVKAKRGFGYEYQEIVLPNI
jgi:hypothetical protein